MFDHHVSVGAGGLQEPKDDLQGDGCRDRRQHGQRSDYPEHIEVAGDSMQDRIGDDPGSETEQNGVRDRRSQSLDCSSDGSRVAVAGYLVDCRFVSDLAG